MEGTGEKKVNKIEPQPGFQEKFLSSTADIVFGGGAAGAGKTYALLMESLRFTQTKGFGATFFRRTYNQIEAIGGLWDESEKIFPLFGAVGNTSSMNWTFKSGVKVDFSHLQHEKNIYDWQGSQIPLIIFDELTHFTRKMFFYLLSRNRSVCGVKPYIRATCNPDAESWVADFIEWWIDEDGYIIPERDGVIRYFSVYQDEVIWGGSKKEVIEKSPHLQLDSEGVEDLVKSFTFIEGDIYENKILLKENPEYLGNLMALSEEDQLRLLKKNWRVKFDKSVIINYIQFKDVFTNEFVKPGRKRITADIATKGSDLLSIWVWSGKRAIDLVLVDKNNGKEAIEAIKALQKKHGVSNSDVCFDADGIGGGMTGFIDGAIEFHNGGKPFFRKNYENLKTQCYYEFSYCINQTDGKTQEDCYYISPEIRDMVYPFNEPKIYRGKTIGWILLHQMKAIKRDKADFDGKLKLIPKAEMKAIIEVSPDLFDGLMMRERFEFIPEPKTTRKTKSSLGLF